MMLHTIISCIHAIDLDMLNTLWFSDTHNINYDSVENIRYA